jgi:uncharacterized membrane protein
VPTLTVWRFPTPYGAEEGELRVKMLRDRGALVVHDLATVIWLSDDDRPQVRQFKHLRGSGAAGGAVIGTVLGSVFLMPLAGAALGAAAGTAARRLRATGISTEFITDLKKQLTPGTSAVLLLASDVDLDVVRQTFPEGDAELIYADLPEDAAESLRQLMEDRAGPDSPDPGETETPRTS